MLEATHNSPAPANPAVACCCLAWNRAYQHARAKGKGEVFAGMDAAQAFRLSCPPSTASILCAISSPASLKACFSVQSRGPTALVSSTPLKSPTPASVA